MNITNYVASLGLMAFLFLIGGKAGATADGPDCFKVKGVKSNDILNVRNQADGSSKIVGTIPYNGDGIVNLGCAEMPDEIRRLAYDGKLNDKKYLEWRRKKFWCLVEYHGVKGYAHGNYLGEGECTASHE